MSNQIQIKFNKKTKGPKRLLQVAKTYTRGAAEYSDFGPIERCILYH